jgi:hypothetical protein
MSTDYALAINRISVYLSDAEHGYVRSIFEPANIRALLLTALFIALRPKSNEFMYKSYSLLLAIYCVHLGVRVGFQDIAILSGRIGSALGFSEIFLLPILLKIRVRSRILCLILGLSYFGVHLYFSLSLTFPFLWDDYFADLY